MWLSFWLNNSHFAIEIFGAAVLFTLTWLTFDAFLLKREFKMLSRALGFLFFSIWLIIHSLNLSNEFFSFFSFISYLAGLSFIFLNLYLEKPLARPKFEIVLVLPAISTFLLGVNILATALFGAIVFFAIKRYREEIQKSLKPFWIAFSFLAVASVLSIINSKADSQQTVMWMLEHVFKIGGYGFLAYWGWQYMKSRIKEEMLLIFVGMALFISIIVTFTFSAILLKNMEGEAEINLISNVRVLDYTFSRMKNEAFSNTQLFSKNKEIINSLSNDEFIELEKVTQGLLKDTNMDFLTVTDEDGGVILRAHSLVAKDDNIKNELAVSQALAGKSYITIESTDAEGLSIRGAAPVLDSNGDLVGAVITGFIIDNAFVDKIKKVTGLEAAIYKNDILEATTILGPDSKTRNIGAKQTDSVVIEKVLKNGESTTARTNIFSRPYLASYLPLKNAEGEIIGMIEASRLQIGIVETAAAANRLTLFISVIIAIMALMPAYFIIKGITEEE